MRKRKKHKHYLGILFSLLLILFTYLAVNVYLGKTFSLDDKVFDLIGNYENESLLTLATYCTFFGSQTFLLPANILLIGIFLYLKKYRSYSWKIALITISSAGFLFLIKFIVKRPRPLSSIADYNVVYSFPSGHSFTSVAFIGILIYFTFTYLQNKLLKFIVIFLSIILIFLIGWSRVYLHVHYATDVIAGFSLGAMWLILSAWFLVDEKDNIKQPR